MQEPVVQDPITNRDKANYRYHKLDGESFKEFIKRTRGLEVPDKALKPKQTKDQRSTQARNAANFRHQKLEGETFVDYLKRTSTGEGKSETDDGLYNDQIDKIMSRFKDFKGCIMRDEIKKLLPDIEPQSRLAFIINTDPSTKEGKHWNAVYIDARESPESSNSLEWYDSFGRGIPPDILEDCKL